MTGPAHPDVAPDAPRRLDVELVRRHLARARAQARGMIEAGTVLVDGLAQTRPATPVTAATALTLATTAEPWVGRAAGKLLEALRVFGEQGLDARGKRCLDVGASTGGFTQVLLHAGAAHVVALDVGHGQLARSLAADPRVTDRPGTNVRHVGPGDLGAPFDLVVADLSFISLRLVLPALRAQVGDDGDLVVLVKPQFEVGRGRLGRTGVVGSAEERARALGEVVAAASAAGLAVQGLVPSPLPGAAGNLEYLLWVTPRVGQRADAVDVRTLIEQVKGQP